MNRKKYDISPDFEQWVNFNPPINGFSLRVIQKLMGWTILKEKSDDKVNILMLNIPYGVGKTMKALLYSPNKIEGNAPCLMYLHGGGFVLPGAPHHFNNCRRYAVGAKCKVLYVDYPLAPKNKYPIPIEACFSAYKWLIENAKNLAIDPAKIAVGGDSAGGNMASVIFLKAKDNKIQLPCAQMLIYPAIGLETETESMKEFTDTPMCNSKDYKAYTKMYFKSKTDLMDRYVSPMKEKDLSIFTKTYIETAEFDCLRDEALIFAKELKKAKVKVSLHKTKQTMHGYDIVEDSEITKESLKKRIGFLKKIFEDKLS